MGTCVTGGAGEGDTLQTPEVRLFCLRLTQVVKKSNTCLHVYIFFTFFRRISCTEFVVKYFCTGYYNNNHQQISMQLEN